MEANATEQSEFTTLVITEIKEETHGTRSYFFDIPKGITWEAGTDVHFALPSFMTEDGPDKALIRHMSMMTLPEEGKIAFTTRVPGSGSVYKKRLQALKPGDEIVMYKIGNRIPLRRENRSVVLVSMGVGIATMRPMILSWLTDPTGIPTMTNLVVNKKGQFVFKEAMDQHVTEGLTHIYSEDRMSFYTSLETVAKDNESIFYVIGNDTFLEDVIKRLKAYGVQPDSIEIDKKPEKKAEMLGL